MENPTQTISMLTATAAELTALGALSGVASVTDQSYQSLERLTAHLAEVLGYELREA